MSHCSTFSPGLHCRSVSGRRARWARTRCHSVLSQLCDIGERGRQRRPRSPISHSRHNSPQSPFPVRATSRNLPPDIFSVHYCRCTFWCLLPAFPWHGNCGTWNRITRASPIRELPDWNTVSLHNWVKDEELAKGKEHEYPIAGPTSEGHSADAVKKEDAKTVALARPTAKPGEKLGPNDARNRSTVLKHQCSHHAPRDESSQGDIDGRDEKATRANRLLGSRR